MFLLKICLLSIFVSKYSFASYKFGQNGSDKLQEALQSRKIICILQRNADDFDVLVGAMNYREYFQERQETSRSVFEAFQRETLKAIPDSVFRRLSLNGVSNTLQFMRPIVDS